MHLDRHVAITALLIFCSNAFTAEGRWTAGFGQGNLEYFIDMQGFQLYIGCPTQNGSRDAASSVSLSDSSGSAINPFTISVNDTTYDAPFEANSRVDTNNFLSLLEGLRKGDAVVTFGGKTIIFPKSNAEAVLPLYGTNKFECNLP